MKKTTIIAILTFLVPVLLIAQIPENYYSDAEGKTSFELKTALYNIIKQHHSLSYGELYTAYETTDTKANQVVWDMYSDIPGGTAFYTYTHHYKNCGNYSREGDCYNREHSFPQSWFSKSSPMRTDLFHVIPSDGKVNGMRSSYPYGEVGNASWTSTNGSKLGSSSFPGYSGTVFEPIDEYKGDFARSYFYMATRYENLIAGWQHNGSADAVLDGSSTRVFDQWCVNLLLKWHTQDPVSQKERDRNKAIYKIQYNRNPFIDYPSFATNIWAGVPSDTTVEDTSEIVIIHPSKCIDFSNIPSGSSSSYTNRSWTDNNGIGWNALLARTDEEINGKAICLKHDPKASLTSSSIGGGLTGLKFTTQQKYSGSGGELSVFINQQLIKTVNVSESATSHSISDLSITGDFTVQFTTNGATRIAIDNLCFEQNKLTTTNELQSKPILVFPNPCRDMLHIQLNDDQRARLEIYNANGRKVYEKNNPSMPLDVNTELFKSGIYIILIHPENGRTKMHKFIRL